MVQIPTENIDANDDISENGEWALENTKAAVMLIQEKRIERLSVHMVEVSFTLKRRPMFSLINIYAPIALMTSLNIATCYVRPDSGERLSFAVTLYLSLVFSTTAAIDTIPNNSLKMPFMSYGILMINLINTVGVTWSIFIVHLASVKITDAKRIPAFILKLLERRRRILHLNNKINPDSDLLPVKSREDGDSQISENANVEEIECSDNVMSKDITGQELAEVVDIVYFWLVSISIFLLLFLFVIIIYVKWLQS